MKLTKEYFLITNAGWQSLLLWCCVFTAGHLAGCEDHEPNGDSSGMSSQDSRAHQVDPEAPHADSETRQGDSAVRNARSSMKFVKTVVEGDQIIAEAIQTAIDDPDAKVPEGWRDKTDLDPLMRAIKKASHSDLTFEVIAFSFGREVSLEDGKCFRFSGRRPDDAPGDRDAPSVFPEGMTEGDIVVDFQGDTYALKYKFDVEKVDLVSHDERCRAGLGNDIKKFTAHYAVRFSGDVVADVKFNHTYAMKASPEYLE